MVMIRYFFGYGTSTNISSLMLIELIEFIEYDMKEYEHKFQGNRWNNTIPFKSF